MKQTFVCSHCRTSVDAEQHRCPNCEARLGFVPELGMLCAFEERGEAGWHPLGVRGLGVRLPCGNYGEHPICNWTVPADAPDCFCESCRCLARVPRLSEPVQRQRWARFGRARRRLFIGLRQLGLLDAKGRLRGLPESLFDVVDETARDRDPTTTAVRANAPGPVLVTLSRIDALTDGELFDALRRAIGLRLCLAPSQASLPWRPGRPVGVSGQALDVDRAIAAWEASWMIVDPRVAIVARRRRRLAQDLQAGGPGVPA